MRQSVTLIINNINVILQICIKFSHSTMTLEFLLHYTEEKSWQEHLRSSLKLLSFIYLPFGNAHSLLKPTMRRAQLLQEGTKNKKKKIAQKLNRPEREQKITMKKELFMLTKAAIKLLSGIGQISYEDLCRKTQLSVNCIRNEAGGQILCTVMQTD